MTSGICLYALIPARKEPSDKAELVTEILFGETYKVLESNDKWLLIRTTADEYTCWIDKKQHHSINDETLYVGERAKRLIEWITEKSSDLTFPVPMGSIIPNENQHFEWNGKFFYRAKDEIAPNNYSVLDYARTYLNTPYRWGGKSPMGIDCSGFVQVLYSLKKVSLPRDAYQQAECGELVSFIDQAQPGDLAFFDNSEGRITHVGIIFSTAPGQIEIIHSSGKVKIDRLDHVGIFDVQAGLYTHNLRLIRRISDSISVQ